MNYALNEHMKAYTLPRKYFIPFAQFSRNLNVFTTFKCLGTKFHESNFIVSQDINCRKKNKHKGKQVQRKENYEILAVLGFTQCRMIITYRQCG